MSAKIESTFPVVGDGNDAPKIEGNTIKDANNKSKQHEAKSEKVDVKDSKKSKQHEAKSEKVDVKDANKKSTQLDTQTEMVVDLQQDVTGNNSSKKLETPESKPENDAARAKPMLETTQEITDQTKATPETLTTLFETCADMRDTIEQNTRELEELETLFAAKYNGRSEKKMRVDVPELDIVSGTQKDSTNVTNLSTTQIAELAAKTAFQMGSLKKELARLVEATVKGKKQMEEDDDSEDEDDDVDDDGEEKDELPHKRSRKQSS